MAQAFRILSIDLKRAIGSIGFILAVAGVCIVYYAGARSEMRYAPDILLLFKYSTEASGINKILILFCVLPYTTSFCSDWNSKYIRPVVVRIGSNKYAWSKIIVCALTSGISVAMGILLFVLPLMLRIPLVSPAAGNYESFSSEPLGGGLLLNGHYIAYYAMYIYLAFLAGAFWSVVGMGASAYISNKFVALFMPFIVLYMLGFISDKLPKWLQLINITNGDYLIGGTFTSLIYATLLVGVLLAGVGLLFSKTIKMRLANE
jgi:hypothetical protein